MTEPQRRSGAAIAVCLIFTVLLTVVDLWTKDWAVDHLPCVPGQVDNCRLVPGRPPSRAGSLVLVDGYLDFSYAENRGAAFSMLHDAPEWVRVSVFTAAAVLFSVALLWWFAKGQGGVLFAWAVPLVVSGALGNLIDRWRLGYVVDFIRFHLHDGWEWPTFNVADITIAIGAGLLILDGFRREEPEAGTTAEADASTETS